MFEEECEANSVQYIPPKRENESITEKRRRRNNIPSTFLREVQKKKNTKIKAKKREMKRVEAFDVNDWLCGRCKDVLSGAHTYKPCTCSRPPPKETFLVTGQGGSPVYSNASVKFCS